MILVLLFAGAPGILSDMYGSISTQNIIHKFISLSQTGDLHTLVYDFDDSAVYVGVAQVKPDNTVIPSYSTRFMKIDAKPLLEDM